jgi:ABC-type Zn uptake system ZnuABC Zn-binding protein ZnuA
MSIWFQKLTKNHKNTKLYLKKQKIHYIMEGQPHSTKHTSNQPHQMKDRASHSQGLSVIQDSVVSS